MNVHHTAIVSKKSDIDDSVEIGPYVIIEDDVVIGPRCNLSANAYVCKGTTIGADCAVSMGVCLGGAPQDMVYRGAKSYLKIGDGNTFREHVTVHRGTAEGSATIIGDNNYFMCLAHIAHNCKIGNNIILCNNALLAGHVEVEDKAFISAACLVHQFVRVGTLSMIGGGVRINKNFPPYMSTTVDNIVESYNIIGLRRAGFSAHIREQIKRAFCILYREDLNIGNAVDKLAGIAHCPEVQHLIDFIRASKRGVCTGRSNRNI